MKDNEFILAVEYCSSHDDCDPNCPIAKETTEDEGCIRTIGRIALGIINRLKAENERLKNSDAVSREYVRICDEEIEDWKSLCNDYKSELIEVAKRIKNIKSEARKELAERLKKEWCCESSKCCGHIDELLEKMESEEK